jgi:uncharacterized protein (TIGR03032 family)
MDSQAADTPAGKTYTLTGSRYFADWLGRNGVSLAFTAFDTGKFFLIGLGPEGRPAMVERTFARCMGLAVSQDVRSLYLASHYQLLRFDNVTRPGDGSGRHDAVYSPHVAWITGDVDAHDVALLPDGRPVFANTLYSCIATVSENHSFRPLWTPPFISRLAPEDRCHLNGLAVQDGAPKYVTIVAASDIADGWRDRKADGGLLMDVETGESVVQGLSMPHSPRVHEGRVWLLNSGAGELGVVDLAAGRFEAVTFCPGFARGLAFCGPYAVVGVSMARDSRTFEGLPLQRALEARKAEPRCAVLVIDTRTGDIVEWLRIEGVVRELYAVALLPGVRNPASIGFVTDEIQRIVTIDDRPSTPEP